MSEIETKMHDRIDCARRFYEYRNFSKGIAWIDLFLDFNHDANKAIPELLVLLDPKYHEELSCPDPRGQRKFPAATRYSKCRSEEIWGYSCPFDNSPVHIDHTFPHSKGGVTHFKNAMYLCDEHNFSKSTDIHLIPWEKMPTSNEWIESSLRIMLEAASRKTTQKLYFPENQLKRL